MSEQDVQANQNEQVVEQNDERQEVKAEEKVAPQQVQPIIVPLQIMPCFYTGPFNNAPTPVQEEPALEKEEEPIPQKKTHFVRTPKEKKPKEERPKRNALQIVCAVFLVLACASMFALSFLGVVETDLNESFGSEFTGDVDFKVEFSTIDLVDFMAATTYDYETDDDFSKGRLAERIEKCVEELQKSVEEDQKSGTYTPSDKTKNLMVKYVKLYVMTEVSFESANGTAAEIHYILAGAFSLLYIAITATMLALSIAWLVFVCMGKESNLGKVTVCMSAVALVVLGMVLLHMIEVGTTICGLSITSICSLAIGGAVLLCAFIIGIARAPKGVRGMVAIKATSAVLVLAVVAFAFAPAIVHVVKVESTDNSSIEYKLDTGLAALEGVVMTEEELESLTFNINGKLKQIETSILGILSMMGQDGVSDTVFTSLATVGATEMLVSALAFDNVDVLPIYSLGYFMIFAVAILSAVCLALIFDFVLGGKNHGKAELALKVIIVVLTLFMLAISAAAIGVANEGYKLDGVENISAMIGYGVVMIAVMSLFSLALDSIVVGIANKKAKAQLEQDVEVETEPVEAEPAVA